MSTISGGSCFRFALTTILSMSADQISGIKSLESNGSQIICTLLTWTALSNERESNIFESRRKSKVLSIFNKEKETSQAWRHEKESFPGPVLRLADNCQILGEQLSEPDGQLSDKTVRALEKLSELWKNCQP